MLDDTLFDQLQNFSDSDKDTTWFQGVYPNKGSGTTGAPSLDMSARFNLKGNQDHAAIGVILENDGTYFDRNFIHELLHYAFFLSMHSYNIMYVNSQEDPARQIELSRRSTFFSDNKIGEHVTLNPDMKTGGQPNIFIQRVNEYELSIPTPFHDVLLAQNGFQMAESRNGTVEEAPLSPFEQHLAHITIHEERITKKMDAQKLQKSMLDWALPNNFNFFFLDEQDKVITPTRCTLTEGVLTNEESSDPDSMWMILRPVHYYPASTTTERSLQDGEKIQLSRADISGSALLSEDGQRSSYKHLQVGRSILMTAVFADGTTAIVPLHSFNFYDWQFQQNNLLGKPLRNPDCEVNLLFRKDVLHPAGANFLGLHG